MRLLVGLPAGAVAAVVLWLALRSSFAAPLFARANHRGADVPVGAGVVLSLAALTVAAVERAFVGLGIDQTVLTVSAPVLLVCLGFGLLGLLDDLAATGDDRGFTGHLRALRHGRLTTGGVKLLGGGLLAVVVAADRDRSRPGWFVVDVLLVALAANLGNLLDRAPGRAIKGAILVGGALAAVHVAGTTGLPVVLGAALGLLWFDLRESLMLGDAGANVLGAVVGLSCVLLSSTSTRAIALVVVALLNLASERVSFSAVIERVPPLRAIDRVGRLP